MVNYVDPDEIALGLQFAHATLPETLAYKF